MSGIVNPYRGLPDNAYWRSAVQERHFFDLDELCQPFRLSKLDRFATAGSCFAQHIGHHLRASGAGYMDMEPRPDFLAESDEKRFGYGIYSCRYGNVYTTRQLLQLAQEAMGQRRPVDHVWQKDGRWFDALRPAVDPVGYEAPEQVSHLRALHLRAVAAMLQEVAVFVFTLGLTEAWMSLADGTVYPTAAGTIVGSHDPAKYAFRNFRYPEIRDDLQQFWRLLRSVNPKARMVLTVSPVPLNATASGEHVLVASSRSKAVLRAVAGDFAEDEAGVTYFPSYEIISSHPARGMFFEQDLRNVNECGVRLVMKHFFKFFDDLDAPVTEENAEIICEEAELDRAAR
jgi:GSCFA family